MKIVHGNLWDFDAEAHVITTNGTVTRAGRAVMGRGCALEAKKMFPGIDDYLGEKIRKSGFGVHYLGLWPAWPSESGKMFRLISFPVKFSWWEQASPTLIATSAMQLFSFAQNSTIRSYVLPRPGCGNGKLEWPSVRKIIEPYLDDRFSVISPKGEE